MVVKTGELSQIKAYYHHFAILKTALSCILVCLSDYTFVKPMYLWLENEFVGWNIP